MPAPNALPQPTSPPSHGRPLGDGRINPIHEHIVTIDGLQLAFRNAARDRLLREGLTELEQLRATPGAETCVVAGNGPSLNDVDWDALDGLPVFAANYAGSHAELSQRMTVLSAVNPWVVSQQPDAFRKNRWRVVLPYQLTYWLQEGEIDIAVANHGRFAPAQQLDDPFSTRSTVSYFNLQLAMCLGYRKILLVGFDHHYTQPQSAAEGDHLAADDQDPNHFSTDYFANKIWQAADTSRMDVAYAAAQSQAQRRACMIINCTTTTQLNIFPRMSPTEALAASLPQSAEPPPLTTATKIAELIGRIRAPKPAAVKMGAALVGAAPALAAFAATDHLLLALCTAGAAFAAGFLGVLLTYASVNVHRQQMEDDWAEISASLKRASSHPQQDAN